MEISEQQRSRTRRLARLGLALWCGTALQTAHLHATDEVALRRVWDQHLASPDDHAGVVRSCRAYIAANPGDPLIPMLQQITAWHLLKAGKIKEAEQVLQPYLAATPGAVNQGATMVARGWFTRLDREKVAESLQAYYRKEVGYPKTLAEVSAHPKIAKDQHPVASDRFGNPWDYKLTGFGKIEGFANQRYSLQSTVLGDSSELEEALAAQYGAGIDSAPLQVMAREEPLVKFKVPGGGGVALITAGQKAGELLLAFVGEQIIIVCNHSYWKVFPRP